MAMNDVHQDRISTDVDWLGAKLKPLSDGKAVVFSLFIARGTGKRKNPIITIVPGEQFGFTRKSVVVSVINIGSCIVEIDCNSTTNLVLAGIPAKLARVLLTYLQSILREVENGNSTKKGSTRGKKRRSDGTSFKSTRTGRATTITRGAYRSSGS